MSDLFSLTICDLLLGSLIQANKFEFCNIHGFLYKTSVLLSDPLIPLLGLPNY